MIENTARAITLEDQEDLINPITKEYNSPAQSFPEQSPWVSWNGNVTHHYEKNFVVKNESDLVARLQFNDQPIRMYGNRYSSADICAGNPVLIDMTEMNKVIEIDREKMQITVEAGMTLATLCERIAAEGWTLPCLPDINAITIGGALATGTHGTGRTGHPLSEYMVACHLVKSDGALEVVEEGDAILPALRISLGTLGIFSQVTFQCEKEYTLQIKERPIKDEEWLQNLDTLLQNHEFVRILWLPHTNHGYLITGDKIPADKEVIKKAGPKWLKYRRTASTFLYQWTHHFPAFTAIANKILFSLFFNSRQEHKGSLYDATVTKKRSATMELSEWTIARSRFPALFKELKGKLEDPSNQAYAHVPMDIRFLQKDDSWLSYAYGEDCVTVGCVCRVSKQADCYDAFALMEETFLKHKGRPHWAKRFKAGHKELSKLFPKWGSFLDLRKKMDPEKRLLNSRLKKIFNESA